MYSARRPGPHLRLRAPSIFVRPASLAMLFALSFATSDTAAEPTGAWRVSHGEDRITRVKALLATSPSTRAQDLMGGLLWAPDSWIGFFCHEGKEGAFLAFFQVPNLALPEHEGPIKHWTVRTRWDEEVHALALLSTKDETVFMFEDASDVARLLNASNAAVVELPSKAGDPIYFVYAVSDARNAVAAARRECRDAAAPTEGKVEKRAAELALKAAFVRERASREDELALKEAESERARRELLAREQLRLEQERKAIFAKALEEYIGAIQSAVARNWRRPTGVPPGLKCTVNVVQANNGKVLRVEITQSSGNTAFDRSVEAAVLAASPLPPPRHKAVFDREIIFLFNPRS